MDIHNSLFEMIGKYIRKERKRQKLTIEQLAELAGIDHTHLGNIERGGVNPTIATLFNIAAGLNLNPLDILTEANNKLYPFFQEEVKKRTTIKKR
jgi:transcriptional regulator with XRE-family HTH domain